jgi:hypothetical protein
LCKLLFEKKKAHGYDGLYSTDVTETVLKNFYLDDCLKSVKTVHEAASLLNDLRDLMKGGFNVTKWISNDI